MIIFRHALAAADPFDAVKSKVTLRGNVLKVHDHRYHLKHFRRISVIGAGKGVARMALATESIFGSRISDGFAVTKYRYSSPLRKIRICEAGHPIPDEKGRWASREISRMLLRTDESDLIVFLISGGASALLPSPYDGITLKDEQKLLALLFDCGATIEEINTLRTHISTLKGGRLAGLAYPSTVISLILSDIVGDPIGSIASGPTAPDESTFNNCMEILERHRLMKKVPLNILDHLNRGIRGQIAETLKKDDPAFLKVQNLIVGNGFRSLQAAKKKALELGYNALIISSMIEGEAREAARNHTAILREIRHSGNPIKSPACIISGGETTVTVRGKGLGGRNMEFVLSAAFGIEGLKHTAVLSAGTDGTDGPTDAAGAVADTDTMMRAKALSMDPRHFLDDNDSYHFFKKLKDLVVTGPTGTNVMDIRILLAR